MGEDTELMGYLEVKLPPEARRRGSLLTSKVWRRRWVVIRRIGVEIPQLIVRLFFNPEMESGPRASEALTLCLRDVILLDRTPSRSHSFAFALMAHAVPTRPRELSTSSSTGSLQPLLFLCGRSESESQHWMANVRDLLWPAPPLQRLETALGHAYDVSSISGCGGQPGIYGHLMVTPSSLAVYDPASGDLVQQWPLGNLLRLFLAKATCQEDQNKILTLFLKGHESPEHSLCLFCSRAAELLEYLCCVVQVTKTLQCRSPNPSKEDNWIVVTKTDDTSPGCQSKPCYPADLYIVPKSNRIYNLRVRASDASVGVEPVLEECVLSDGFRVRSGSIETGSSLSDAGAYFHNLTYESGNTDLDESNLDSLEIKHNNFQKLLFEFDADHTMPGDNPDMSSDSEDVVEPVVIGRFRVVPSPHDRRWSIASNSSGIYEEIPDSPGDPAKLPDVPPPLPPRRPPSIQISPAEPLPDFALPPAVPRRKSKSFSTTHDEHFATQLDSSLLPSWRRSAPLPCPGNPDNYPPTMRRKDLVKFLGLETREAPESPPSPQSSQPSSGSSTPKMGTRNFLPRIISRVKDKGKLLGYGTLPLRKRSNTDPPTMFDSEGMHRCVTVTDFRTKKTSLPLIPFPHPAELRNSLDELRDEGSEPKWMQTPHDTNICQKHWSTLEVQGKTRERSLENLLCLAKQELVCEQSCAESSTFCRDSLRTRSLDMNRVAKPVHEPAYIPMTKEPEYMEMAGKRRESEPELEREPVYMSIKSLGELGRRDSRMICHLQDLCCDHTSPEDTTEYVPIVNQRSVTPETERSLPATFLVRKKSIYV